MREAGGQGRPGVVVGSGVAGARGPCSARCG